MKETEEHYAPWRDAVCDYLDNHEETAGGDISSCVRGDIADMLYRFSSKRNILTICKAVLSPVHYAKVTRLSNP